jgi:hypothetical protein
MAIENEQFAGTKRRTTAAITFALLLTGSGNGRMRGQSAPEPTNMENRTMTTQTRFYCNIKALNPTERARHKQLTDKLIAARTQIVETEKGYEFQYSPSTVSLAELAEWVVAESKCCPFFDFHIDVEHEGSLLCLRLTGEAGIKPFILAEFEVRKK